MARTDKFKLQPLAAAAALLMSGVSAHMEISSPPPRRSRFGSTAPADIDYNMMAPLPVDGSGLPCKGYAAAAPVTTLQAGAAFNVTAYGATFHGGGHCQISLSYNDRDFVALTTVMGNCFTGSGLVFPVTLPSTTPACNRCTIAWTWVNAVGNRELYMNCIDVSITNAATPPASQQVTGKRTVFANQPGYPTIPEFGLGYDGTDIYAAAPTITITATGTSGGAGASPSSSPAVVVVASPSASASKPAAAASPSASASRAAASPAAASASPSPVPLASVLPSGSRILDYLHARGEALDITTPAPVKAVYADYRDISWSRPDTTIRAMADAGYNVIIMAFYLSDSGAVDFAGAWTTAIGDAERAAAVAYAHSKGAIVLMSVGGATDGVWHTKDAATLGTRVGQYALSMRLDGVDFDLENLGPGCVIGSLTAAQTVAWMAQVSIATREALGAGGFIAHAPQAPYFGPISPSSSLWAGPTGCYSGVAAQAKWTPPGASAPVPAIDWYLSQFYNQGSSCYTTYEGLFTRSAADCAVFPGTSVAEIASYGVPLNSIVVGKYLLEGVDAGNGFVSAANLRTYMASAKTSLNYDGGVMCWAWQAAGSASWIATIYPAATGGASPSAVAAASASPSASASRPAAASSTATQTRSVAASASRTGSASPSRPAAASASASASRAAAAASPSSAASTAASSSASASSAASSSSSPLPSPSASASAAASTSASASALPSASSSSAAAAAVDAVCSPGATICLSANSSAVCAADGASWVPAPCRPGMKCRTSASGSAACRLSSSDVAQVIDDVIGDLTSNSGSAAGVSHSAALLAVAASVLAAAFMNQQHD